MQDFETLIQKLWKGTISQDELLSLKKLIDEYSFEYNTKSKNDFGVSMAGDTEYINPLKVAYILQTLHRQIDSSKNREIEIRKIIHWVSWTAAACLILFISGFYFFNKENNKTNTAVTINNKMQLSALKKITNTNDKVMVISLKDSSQVKLYPNSSITYIESFSNVQRNISLVGKAFFKVAKDKKRPFTVTSDGFATTALGTEFIVNTQIENEISVKLFEGKVVIRPIEKGIINGKNQYLIPGQEFVFDKITKKNKLFAFRNDNVLAVNEKKSKEDDTKSTLSFNNESLQKVLTRLGIAYNIKIVFNANDIKGRFFTGSFSKEDDVKNILLIICNINGLEYVQNEYCIEIRKHK